MKTAAEHKEKYGGNKKENPEARMRKLLRFYRGEGREDKSVNRGMTFMVRHQEELNHKGTKLKNPTGFTG